jgi:hypothetical protein
MPGRLRSMTHPGYENIGSAALWTRNRSAHRWRHCGAYLAFRLSGHGSINCGRVRNDFETVVKIVGNFVSALQRAVNNLRQLSVDVG